MPAAVERRIERRDRLGRDRRRRRRRTGPSTGDAIDAGHVDRRRRVVAPRPDERAVEPDDARRDPSPSVAARNDIRPPMQKPSVKTRPAGAVAAPAAQRARRRPRCRPRCPPRSSARRAACTRTPRRGRRPARSARTSRWPGPRSRAPRTAGPAPRSTDGGRGRRGGSRRRAPPGAAARAGTPRTRFPSAAVSGSCREPSSAPPAIGRDRRSAVVVEAHRRSPRRGRRAS